MSLDISDLRAVPHSRRELEWEPALSEMDWNGRKFLLRPTVLHVQLQNTPRGVQSHVQGEVTVSYPCDRCLKPHDEDISLDYRELFATPAQAADALDEDEDLEVVVNASDRVDLEEGLEKAVLLNLPTKHLCQANCKGLCPRCGADLNAGACDCPAEAVDPRLARLADWLNREGNRNGKS